MQHQKAQDLWQNNADVLKTAAKYQFGSAAGNEQVSPPPPTIIMEETVQLQNRTLQRGVKLTHAKMVLLI